MFKCYISRYHLFIYLTQNSKFNFNFTFEIVKLELNLNIKFCVQYFMSSCTREI